ncbi:MAG TPA: SDR family oxidoreductase [Kofleriaceae bacterium]|jgi:NAD(P)-dependent dehydrogenase (short-subunit alcohol dehydrogenase family)|nr:SDR family oxidoreductase [Kofleriaceae bacterium]
MNRLALVTGGGRGIGAAIARALARTNVRVIVSGRSSSEIDEVARSIGGVAIRADLGDRADADRLVASVKEIGRVDILVNNAGLAESATLDKTDDALWDRTMELNATAPYRLCRALAPAMIANGWGRIINIASNAGVSGYAYTSAYCASKHAVVGFTRALAVDLARTGVTINAVCPGWVATKMADDAVARIAAKTGRSAEEARATLAAMSPQRRLIEPDEVAHTVVMLAADDARGIHGQAILIDGGQVLK